LAIPGDKKKKGGSKKPGGGGGGARKEVQSDTEKGWRRKENLGVQKVGDKDSGEPEGFLRA